MQKILTGKLAFCCISATLALSSFAVSAATYSNKTVDFQTQSAGATYTDAKFTTDFGNLKSSNTGSSTATRTTMDTSGDKRLRVTMQAGTYDSNSGIVLKSAITKRNSYTLEYQVKFSSSWPISAKGGKLPGLGGGAGYTGGAHGLDGMSVRVMFGDTANTGKVRLYPYVYFPDMSTDFGETLMEPAPSNMVEITTGAPHTIKMYVKMNSSNYAYDGQITMWVDGVQTITKSGIRLKAAAYNGDDTWGIDTLNLCVFAGGGNVDWAMPSTSWIEINDVHWY